MTMERWIRAIAGSFVLISLLLGWLHSPYWWLKCLVGVDNEGSWLVKHYHRFLVWDMMQRPMLTRVLESLLSPAIGKSVVFYGVKH